MIDEVSHEKGSLESRKEIIGIIEWFFESNEYLRYSKSRFCQSLKYFNPRIVQTMKYQSLRVYKFLNIPTIKLFNFQNSNFKRHISEFLNIDISKLSYQIFKSSGLRNSRISKSSSY